MGKALTLLAFAAAIGVTPSFADQAAPLSDTIGTAEVSAMLTEYGISSEVKATANGGSPSLIATTAGGAKFLIGFFDCADAAKPAGCKQVMISTAQASGGVEFEDLNNFNGQSSVTTVVYEPSNQILIFGRNIFLPGGVGRDNFKLQVALFLGDMQNFVEGRRANTKSVSFSARPDLSSKIDSITADSATPSPTLSISHDRSAEVEMAIGNSLDADFRVGNE